MTKQSTSERRDELLAAAKQYDPIEWMRGNSGEDPGTMSVVAMLDPSPYYPEVGRIICGSPANSESDLGGFCCGPEQAVRFAETLEMAARDADAAIDAPTLVTELRGRPKRCEVCCGEIRIGARIVLFQEWNERDGNGSWRDVVAHADRCTDRIG